MSILSDWLKEIIFVVLIAIIIDLLLPNRSMERYVRFVASLIILLTLLSPIMKLLSMPSAEKLEMAISDNISGMDNPEMDQSTEQILRQGNDIRKKRESEALQWTGEEAARQMKTQIQTQTGRQVIRVAVKLSAGSDPGSKSIKSNSGEQTAWQQSEPRITEVEVVMADESAAIEPVASSERKSSADRVEPVENVQVAVSIQPEGTQESSVPANSNVKAHSGEADDQLVQQIEQLLLEEWGVPRGAVSIAMQQK
ncbi:Stage III sporulation protein AF [compost metagenome]